MSSLAPPVAGIDPGHGGRNLGAQATSDDGVRIFEKHITMEIARTVKRAVPNAVMTRGGDDETEEFTERARVLREGRAQVVFSLHCDSTPWDTSVYGTHAYYRRGDRVGAALARYATRNGPVALRLPRGGVICANDNPRIRSDDWKARAQRIVECYAPLPVCLFELGYMSNERDLRFLVSREGVAACAGLVVDMIEQYHVIRSAVNGQ